MRWHGDSRDATLCDHISFDGIFVRRSPMRVVTSRACLSGIGRAQRLVALRDLFSQGYPQF